jgi:dTDP-4-amino-4,6-dideoxygalactose transaminase
MTKFYQLSKPNLDQSELSAIGAVLQSGYLGMGKSVEEFETKISSYLDNNCVAVSSCTAALFLSLEACGIGNGDEVLVQSMTYTATYQAILNTGAIPIACEIHPENLSVNLRDAESKITSRTKAIVPVHYNGFARSLKEILEFGRIHNLRVIEDAAHAFGCRVENTLVGSCGEITCFSFDPVKSLTCGEGGAIVSADLDIIDRVKKTRFIGIDKSAFKTNSTGFYQPEQASTLGWRYHMSNINAAIGLSQFNKFSMIKERRQMLAKRYDENLKNISFVELLPYNYDEIIPYLFVVKLKKENNQEVIKQLSSYGIQAAYHYFPCHLQSYFKKYTSSPLPVTEKLYKHLLSLPMHIDLTVEDVDYISEILIRILTKGNYA